MFVITKNFGDSESQKTEYIGYCEDGDDAKKCIDILYRIHSYSKNETNRLYYAKQQYKASLSYHRMQNKPNKSVIDPYNNISERDWIENYMMPYHKDMEMGLLVNKRLDLQVEDFMKNYPRVAIPEEFKLFEKEIHIQDDYPYNNDSFVVYEYSFVKKISF